MHADSDGRTDVISLVVAVARMLRIQFTGNHSLVTHVKSESARN